MKVLGPICTIAIVVLSHQVVTRAADLGFNRSMVSQSSVSVTTENNGAQTSASMVSLDRVDLRQPHILRVQGAMNNDPIKMKRVDVKINGKMVKTIANGSLELDLAPMMTAGRYEIQVFAISPQSDNTISLNFIGAHAQIKQQSSGTGNIDRKLIINVR
ncbi:MAG: hypothetical protein RLZZ135_1955 [Cyanobacteriota bacterium]|jgi:hypothetical protein